MARKLAPIHVREKQKRLGVIREELFARACDKFADSIEELSVSLIQDFATRIAEGTVELTPVRTGRARANWQLTVGSANEFSYAGDFSVNPLPKIFTTIDSIKDASRPIFFFNNVEYIQNLEEGYSRQAPQGMLQITLQMVSEEMGGYVDALDKAISLDDLEYEL